MTKIKPRAKTKSRIHVNPVRSSHGALNPVFAKIKPHSSSRLAARRSASNGVNKKPAVVRVTKKAEVVKKKQIAQISISPNYPRYSQLAGKIFSGFTSLTLILAIAIPLNALAISTPPVIQINTVTDSEGTQTEPFDFSCATNPLFNPISIAGGGVSGSNPQGQNDQYNIQIDWGDGTIQNSEDDPSVVSAVINPLAGREPFTFTFNAGPHSYTSPGGNFTIIAKLYHQKPPGRDGQADATIQISVCVHVSPPDHGSLTVTKIVNGGTAQVSDFTLKVGDTAVASGAINDFEAGSYIVSESGGPAGYAGEVVCDSSGNENISIVAPNHYDCIITNTFITPPVDVCPNIDGDQVSVPDGMQIDNDGNCVPIPPPPTDVCPNIDGLQTEIPDGYELDDEDNCVPVAPPPVDVCPNIDDLQTSVPDGMQIDNDGNCVPILPPPVDVCPNLDGAQAEVPDGYELDGENNCVLIPPPSPPPPPPTDVCPNIDGVQETVPDGMEINGDGNCVETVTPPSDVCPNIVGVQTEVPGGYHLADGVCVEDQTPVTDLCPNLDGIQESVPAGYQLENGQCVTNSTSTPPVSESNSGSGNSGGGTGGGNSGGQTSGVTTGNGNSAGTQAGDILGAETSCDANGPYLLEYIKLGRNNNPEEVKKLQLFLNDYEGEHLPVTGFYGPLTFEASERFQMKYWQVILTPWVPYGFPNDKEPSGWVYKTTKRWVNLLYCNTLDPSMPQLP